MDIRECILSKYNSCNVHALDEYIKICNTEINVVYLERHHILPKHDFVDFENLDVFKWNCSKLSYRNHCLAHYWYAKCVDTENAWLSAMCMFKMNKNKLNNRDFNDILDLADISEESKIKWMNHARKSLAWEHRESLYTLWIDSELLYAHAFSTWLKKITPNIISQNLN